MSTASRASIASSVGSRASVFSAVSMVPHQEDEGEQNGGGQKKFRGVRSIQMPFLRVDMAEKEESTEDQEQRELEEERLRAVKSRTLDFPARYGNHGNTLGAYGGSMQS